jgi:hypothetical protein
LTYKRSHKVIIGVVANKAGKSIISPTSPTRIVVAERKPNSRIGTKVEKLRVRKPRKSTSDA